MATIDKLGRISIPKKVREDLGITPNTKLTIEKDGRRIIIEPVRSDAPVTEKEGILVFTGKLTGHPDEVLKENRKDRLDKLLPK